MRLMRGEMRIMLGTAVLAAIMASTGADDAGRQRLDQLRRVLEPSKDWVARRVRRTAARFRRDAVRGQP